jgi:outer membrane protein assembly factor BamE
MQKLLKLLVALLFVSSAFLTGCGAKVPIIKPFKMDIQQGNVVTSKMLLQLKPGMTKSQVKFIMGTPLVVDSFHTNRWDYFYQMRQAGKIIEQRRVILEFEKELLLRVRGDVVPEGTAGAVAGGESGAAKTITVEPKAKEESLLDKLKFWKSDPKPADAKPAPKEVAPEIQPEINLRNPANDAPEANNDAAAGEVPSVLAVPIEITPVPDAPAVEVNKIEAPVVDAPKVEPLKAAAPKLEPVKVEPPKAAPIKPAELIKPVAPAPVKPAPITKPVVKQDEPFSFRMDRNLDTKNLEAAPVEAAPVAKPKVDPAPLEAEPGYFEKMLEKIGF